MIYIYFKRIINNSNYGIKEEMQQKLDVFLLNNRLNDKEYTELSNLLKEV